MRAEVTKETASALEGIKHHELAQIKAFVSKTKWSDHRFMMLGFANRTSKLTKHCCFALRVLRGIL